MNLAAGRRVCAAPGRGLDRLDTTHAFVTNDRTAMTPRVNFIATDTSFGGYILLKEDRYKSVDGAELRDDGIIDDVAVQRRIAGDPVRITPRELICVVAEGARRGLSDLEIAGLLGRDDDNAKDWITRLRERNRIDAGIEAGDGYAAVDAVERRRLAAA